MMRLLPPFLKPTRSCLSLCHFYQAPVTRILRVTRMWQLTHVLWDCHRMLSGLGLGDCHTGLSFPDQFSCPAASFPPSNPPVRTPVCLWSAIVCGTTRMESFLSGFTFPVLQQEFLHPILGSAHLWSAMWLSPSDHSLWMSQLDSQSKPAKQNSQNGLQWSMSKQN